MDSFLEPLAHGFVRRALVAGVAVAAAAAFLGTFVVQRGLAFLTDGLAHATFGGLAIGLLLGTSVESAPWVALPFVVLVAVGIAFVRRRSGLGADVATGVFFTLSFAVGVVSLGLRSPRAPAVDVESLLFGSILSVSEGALLAILVASAATLALLAWVSARLAYATFDPELAALSGVRVVLLEYVLMGLVAVVVVAGLRSVGVVLVSALVVIPAATAHLLGRRLLAIAMLSVALGTGATVAGVLVSYHLNLATGATIVALLGALFFLALAFRPLRG